LAAVGLLLKVTIEKPACFRPVSAGVRSGYVGMVAESCFSISNGIGLNFAPLDIGEHCQYRHTDLAGIDVFTSKAQGFRI
jgi:hypothetical protein